LAADRDPVAAAPDPTSPESDPASPESELVRLVALVERAAHSRGWGQPAQLLRIDPGPDAVSVAVRPLPPGAHPEQALLGFSAPTTWPTLGVVAEGGATPLTSGDTGRYPSVRRSSCRSEPPERRRGTVDGPGGQHGHRCRGDDANRVHGPGPGGRRRHRRRVRVALVVARSRLVVSQVRVADDEPVIAVHRPGEPPPVGRVVDLLFRSLDLATAPPPPTTTSLWAVLWLQSLLASIAGGRPPTWAAIAALHPATQLSDVRETPDPGPGPGQPAVTAPPASGRSGDVASLVRAGTTAGSVVSWEHLRLDAAAGRWRAPRLHPGDAEWMDAGAFARWVAAELPDLDHLVTRVRTVLPRPLTTRVVDVLARSGLPTGTGR
jgi:hypothetical protein